MRNTKPINKIILILDTIGQLSEFYSIADIVFMGGSLIKKGGHNIIEPARFGKAVLFGPYMNNFRDMANRFLSKGASVMVKDKHRLKEVIRSLLKDKTRIADMGEKAAFLIEQNKGAVSEIIGEIKKVLI
ncbi:MAG: glycosyltransferase [Candidatus Omnitrophica bacterium]|nr:glycosyltransferase [Candidatus Omnitrophota bacterium]